MDFLTCVSPLYLKAHGTPRCPKDFQQHQWIGFSIKETQQLQPIFLPDEHGEYLPYELERSHITDDGEAMAQMCADGLGFAQLPHFLAQKCPKVRVFIEFLTASLAAIGESPNRTWAEDWISIIDFSR